MAEEAAKKYVRREELQKGKAKGRKGKGSGDEEVSFLKGWQK